MTTEIKQTAIKYGIIGFVITSAGSVVMAMTDTMTKPWAKNVNSILMIGILAYAIYEFKHKLNRGQLTIKEGLSVSMFASLIWAVLGAIFSLIFFTYISPETLDAFIQQARIDMMNKGMDDEQIENGINIAKPFFSAGAISIMAFIFTLIFGFIIGLISSAIMRKQ